MHRIQQLLLQLAGQVNLGDMSLRQMGELIGEESPQKIKHHLNQLEKRGLIRIDSAKRLIEKTRGGAVSGLLTTGQLLSIPILGAANAGPATMYADGNLEGYLRISSTFVGKKANRKLFALRVNGPSMNRANVGGQTIEDGDYVIVDSEDQIPSDGDIILSIIDGLANIKRFHIDKRNRQIVLASDSTLNFPPIHIHESDAFRINGKVIQVIKKRGNPG